jgi:putative ABC transport system substrate-binding protein
LGLTRSDAVADPDLFSWAIAGALGRELFARQSVDSVASQAQICPEQKQGRRDAKGHQVEIARRKFALALIACAACLCSDAHGQRAARVFRLGLLATGAPTPDGKPSKALRDALQNLGYTEGRDIVYEVRFADNKPERLSGMAAELAALPVDVIVAQGGLATRAAKGATTAIPIVMAQAAGDAVATSLIASLARPGGNITGLTDEVAELSAKRMQLLKEAVPKATRIAVIWNANDEGMTVRYRGIVTAARALQVEVDAISVREPGDFAAAITTMRGHRPDAIFLVTDALASANRKLVIDFAAAERIPAMYEFASYVRDGGFMSYGPSPEDGFRQAAVYIDKIFKGAKPADLPAEQPTRYYLNLNRATAASLGLPLPQSLLVRADEVIQ